MKDYKRLFGFAKPYYRLLALAGVFMGVVTFFDIFRLSAIVPIVDRVFTNKPIVFTKGQFPGFIEHILNQLNAFPPLKVLYLILIIMPIALIIRAIFEYFQSYIMSEVGQKVVMDVRNQIYERLQSLSLEFFVRKRSGELISRITNDVKLIENAVSYAFTDLIYQSFTVFAFAVMTFVINWRLAFISVIVLPLVAGPMFAVGKALRKLSKKSQEKIADINSLLVETLTGVRIVKAFCAEERELTRFKGQNYSYYKLTMKSIKRMLILGIATELTGVAMALFIIFYSGRKVIEGALSFGMFTLFMAALLSLIRPFKKLSQVNSIMEQALAASTRIYEILDMRPTVVERAQAAQCPGFKNSVTFQDVCFSYAEQVILRDINVTVSRGAMLAIVGHSGSGKSTMVDLLPRFYDPQQGRILIDGRDIREFTLKSLRGQIAIVTQETILFNDTIRQNIAYGRPEASQQEIEDVARQAYIHDFIKTLPQGYDTVIGDRGAKLSGGERQRVAIARALLKNPPILILDEATSQLDSASERIVQEALNRLIQGRTVLMVAHRLSTIRSAHRIIVLDKGSIIEAGTHDELVNRDTVYKRLWLMQQGNG